MILLPFGMCKILFELLNTIFTLRWIWCYVSEYMWIGTLANNVTCAPWSKCLWIVLDVLFDGISQKCTNQKTVSIGIVLKLKRVKSLLV